MITPIFMMMEYKKLLLIFLFSFFTLHLLAEEPLSYQDIRNPSFDKPSSTFQICFEKKFNKVKENKLARTKFFTSLKISCKNQTLDDKKYIIKSCIVNGYLQELKLANKNHNIGDSIDYAKAQIITDCENYLYEVIPKLTVAERKELNSLIPQATIFAKQKIWIK